MVVIETPRLILRRLCLTDYDALTRVFCDAEVMRFGDGVQSAEWVRRWVDDRIAEYRKTDGVGPWAVVEIGGNEPIGYCGQVLPLAFIIGGFSSSRQE